MGQSSSNDLEGVESLPDELFRQARQFSEVATLTYDEFQEYLKQLNELSQKCMDADGKQLVFAVKEGSDSTVLWKGMIRIACVKVDPVTEQVETYRLLNLSQFIKGDIPNTIAKLTDAVAMKSSPALRQFIAVQELVVRLPLEHMQEFHKNNKKFFSQGSKFLEMDVEFDDDDDPSKRRKSQAQSWKKA